jgi:hypothetical protein
LSMKRKTKIILVSMVALAFFLLVPVAPTPDLAQGGTDCKSSYVGSNYNKVCWQSYEYSSVSYLVLCFGGTLYWASDMVHTVYEPVSIPAESS